MFADRKVSYKLPPTIIRDKLLSQEARRSKALEEQKRKRAQRIDSSRQLDLFADLKLGDSDDDDDFEEQPEGVSNVTPASVAPFTSMFEPSMPRNAITEPMKKSAADPETSHINVNKDPTKKKQKKRRKRNNASNKWADKCMYAELLEMSPDDPWTSNGEYDGLPRDIEDGWVAVAPVPVGKRCMAITHQSAGVVGVAPNTTLRSRLLGKMLIQRFPSNLPPLTVLDCILDVNWRDNGIVHVLDVVKWKGQDVGDCEARFRFWWRDTRLAELSQRFPPNIRFSTNPSGLPDAKRHFPYPTKFLPIPYHTDTSLSALQSSIIPLARVPRSITVDIPTFNATNPNPNGGMDVESPSGQPFRFTAKDSVAITSVSTDVEPDGLLLYVAEASYEPGTSPLSSWIPITGYSEGKPSRAATSLDSNGGVSTLERPLDLFQKLVERRLKKNAAGDTGVSMDMDER